MPVTHAPAVPIANPTSYGNGVAVRVVTTVAVTGTATLPGEVAGPAVAVTVEITNHSTGAIGLNSVIVDLTKLSGAPASMLRSSPASPLHGTLTAGSIATGTYVFSVSPAERGAARIAVSYAAGLPVAQFTGNLPSA